MQQETLDIIKKFTTRPMRSRPVFQKTHRSRASNGSVTEAEVAPALQPDLEPADRARADPYPGAARVPNPESNEVDRVLAQRLGWINSTSGRFVHQRRL